MRRTCTPLCTSAIIDIVRVGSFGISNREEAVGADSGLTIYEPTFHASRGALRCAGEDAVRRLLGTKVFNAARRDDIGNSVQETLDNWKGRYSMRDALPVVVFRTLPQLAMVMLHACWYSIAYPLPSACRHRSSGHALANNYVFAGYDPKLLRPLADSLDDVFAKEPIGGTLQDIADNIRGWSKAIINHGHLHPQMNDAFFTSPFVGSVVSWLDSKARDPLACSTLASLTTPVSTGVRTYRVGVMVKILMLCKSLTTARDLDRVVKLVLKTVLEPQAFRETLASLEKFPHPSTISRYAFYIDMAYARYWRVQRWPRILEDLACGKASVDFSGDSSPQFGRDWFLMEIHVIDNLEELDRVHTELLALLPGDAFMVEAAWSRWFESQSQETIANIVKLTAAITSLVVRHVLIPTGLAARRTSLLNKMHNVLHAFMVDIGQWRRVLQLLNLITSVCTDQGPAWSP